MLRNPDQAAKFLYEPWLHASPILGNWLPGEGHGDDVSPLCPRLFSLRALWFIFSMSKINSSNQQQNGEAYHNHREDLLQVWPRDAGGHPRSSVGPHHETQGQTR